jgi:hypothetical protein
MQNAAWGGLPLPHRRQTVTREVYSGARVQDKRAPGVHATARVPVAEI